MLACDVPLPAVRGHRERRSVVAETAKPIALVAAYGSRQLDRFLRAIADGSSA
jgi:hypothetical protein